MMKYLPAETVIKLRRVILILIIIAPIILAFIANYYTSYLSASETDFCQDYISAKYLTEGLSPYQKLSCWGLSNEYNPHPPFSLLIYVPLLIFELKTASFLWGILSMLFYFSALYLLLKILNLNSGKIIAFIFGINLLSYPFLISFIYQNIMHLLLLLLTCAWYFSLKKRYYLSGFLIGFATLLRFWPFLFLLPFLFIKNNKIVIAAALTFFLGILITFYGNGLQYYQQYLGPVQNAELAYIARIENISFITLLARFLYVLGIEHNQAVIFSKFSGAFIFIALLYFSFIHSSALNKKSNILNLNIATTLTLVYFIFPVLWEWALLLFMLTLSMIYYTAQKLTSLPKKWWRLFSLCIFLLFPLRYLPYYILTEITDSQRADNLFFLFIHNFSLLIAICLILYLQFQLIEYLKQKKYS